MYKTRTCRVNVPPVSEKHATDTTLTLMLLLLLLLLAGALGQSATKDYIRATALTPTCAKEPMLNNHLIHEKKERDRQTNRQADRQRQTDRDRQTETDRQTDRQTETETDRQTERERQRQTDRRTYAM